MVKRLAPDLQLIVDFLQIETPESWRAQVPLQLPLLLIDHAHCERKAAATALNFISKYPQKKELIDVMSPLAREELLHFEKVMNLLNEKNIVYAPLTPSEYASNLHQHATKKDGTERLCDLLIIGAIIEARSCERFNIISSLVSDPSLAKFYQSLVKAEARHFLDYLALAQLYGGNTDSRIAKFIQLENKFINSQDVVFRFHSGIPSSIK